MRSVCYLKYSGDEICKTNGVAARDVDSVYLDLTDCNNLSMYQGLFTDCSKLQEVSIYLGHKDLLVSFKDMFINCPQLRKVTLIGNVSIIQTDLDFFAKCKSNKLRYIDLSGLHSRHKLVLNSAFLPNRSDCFVIINSDTVILGKKYKFNLIENLN